MFADIKLDRNANQNTSIDRAQNGQAAIININTPNNKGISVNDFENFQTKEGVVFNNFGEGVGRSYLAGMMAANPNLSKEQAARLILNRVGGNNRVEIEAFLEVMSSNKTDMVFSSTNGFYLNNTGFINFDKVMFTTSRVDVDGNGNLLPFNIRGGDITVGRDGINAEGVRYLALLSKSINIDGQIHAKDAEVDLIAGNFDYNPDTKEYTKQGTNNNELLISSSAFGSVYGNQIKIVAVNGNVGVNGDVISERVLRINADGTIVTNRMQAKESIDIKAKEFTQESSTYSEGKVKIEADKTSLKGSGTQAGELEVTGNLESNVTVYSKGNITVGGDTKSNGQLLSEGSLEVRGNLEASDLVYGKDEIKVGKSLTNKSDLQSEGNVTVGGDVTNTGKVFSDKNLNIKGNTVNQGTLYGKDSIKIEKNLNSSGNIQTAGDLSAKDTVNTGNIVAEGDINTENIGNSGEVVTNKKLSTKNLDNRTSGKINTGNGISTSGNVSNQGTMNTNGDLIVNEDFENNNIVNAGGTLTAKDVKNTGVLKVSDRIVSRGVTFTNSGEVLTENLDVVVSGNVVNTNKIIVLDNAKLKGNSIINQNYISATNMELVTLSLTNTGTLAADGVLKANNTFINNAGGYIGSNQKVELNNTNLTNSGTIESASIELSGLSGYGNTGLIRGNSVVLTSGGNLTLNGTLHGEDYLQVNGLDILNSGVTTGAGYIEIKGRDIINNTELASEIIVLEGTGTVVNNSMITGENGRISAYNIVNNELIAFSEQLGLIATDKITNNAGMAIYGGELLDIEFNTLENLSGELLSTGLINLKGNYLLNQTGMIQSSGDISMEVTKIDNIGSVKDLNKYELYYETWDGYILTPAEVAANWAGVKLGENKSNKFEGLYRTGLLAALKLPKYQFLLANIFLDDLWALDPNAADYEHFRQGAVEGYFDRYPMSEGSYIRTSSAQFPGVALKGKLKSNAVTTYANISAGNNISITGNELNNKDGKISAGNTAELTVNTITNTTTLGNRIQLKDGVEYYKQEHYGSGSDRKYHVQYWRGLGNGDIAYVTGQASVIEARNLIINTGNLILTPEIDTNSQIITGSTAGGGFVDKKTLNTKSGDGGSGQIVIIKNMDPILDIKATGILPINPLAAQSSLFSTSNDPTSKYLMETRSKYINLNNFYGSDYYLSRIGYDEGSDWNKARRLGDAYYEYLLVTRTLTEKLGTRFINGLSDSELMKAMLDNSVELQKDLQLTVGVALTADQVKALKSDVIWYEYEVVNGEKVLVPKVYLSQATLATIEPDGRNKIGGLELTAINADELRNNGQLIGNGGVTYVNAGRVYNVTNTNELAEIRGNEVTVIATAGNIENIGGRIKGIESVALVVENGDIINSSSTSRTQQYTNSRNSTQHDSILSVGSIESEGMTYIEGKNYISEAGRVSGATTIIDVKENITIGSLTLNGSDRSGSSGDNYANYDSVQKIGSEVIGTDNVILNAGRDITVKGSTVASDGTVQMTAENINILNEVESIRKETKQTDNGFMSTHSIEEKSYQEYAAGSTVVGNNIILDASNDINVRASTIAAVKSGIENTGGNISMVAGNDVNILVDTLDNSYSFKEKKSGFSTNLASGGGSFTAGVSYSKSSLEQQRNGTTVAVSSIISEGSTVIDAGNRVRTEAMQANIGENLVIRGVNGVELLDAKEVYEEKIKQKTTTVGVSLNVGFTPAQLANTVSDVAGNVKDYGFDNTSQTINTLGNGISDLRSVSGLTGNLRGWAETKGYIAVKDVFQHGNLSPDNLRNAAKGLVSASVSASFSQSSYESNTSSTISVAGVINVGKNFVIESEGDVKLVNQKISVGENFVVDAKSFEARAGENTYSNSTKSSSVGGSIGYDIVNNNAMGGLNISGGKSNTNSKYYDNTFIGVGGTFQLTTKDDATFAGVNVIADKLNFDIGKNLNIISLQDEYKSDGKNYGAGINVSGRLEGTKYETGSARPSIGGNYGENHQDSKWVSNQTSIIGENGGNIKVGETLTNIGAVIGSLNEESKLGIEAKKVVIENLKDYNEGENYGIGLSGISLKDPKTVVPQTSIQYGSHDKQQDSNATFVNTEVTEAGKKLNLEELGINTDITKAQVVTKDKVVEQIDTEIHTDLLNETTRNQFIKDVNGLVQLPGDIIKAIQVTMNNEESNFLDNLVGTLRNTDSDMTNTLTMKKKYDEFNKKTNLSPEEKAEQVLLLANESANSMRGDHGIDKDTPILVLFADESKGDEAGAFLREDGMLVVFIDPSKTDVSDAKSVYNTLMFEMNHYNPSNPYVYDQKEKEVTKDTLSHRQEEGFTSIGRKDITGEGNAFYDEIKGSKVLNIGNGIYGSIDPEDLDYRDYSINGFINWGTKKAKNTAIGINNLCNKNEVCKEVKKDAKKVVNVSTKVVVNNTDKVLDAVTDGKLRVSKDIVEQVNKPEGTTKGLKKIVEDTDGSSTKKAKEALVTIIVMDKETSKLSDNEVKKLNGETDKNLDTNTRVVSQQEYDALKPLEEKYPSTGVWGHMWNNLFEGTNYNGYQIKVVGKTENGELVVQESLRTGPLLGGDLNTFYQDMKDNGGIPGTITKIGTVDSWGVGTNYVIGSNLAETESAILGQKMLDVKISGYNLGVLGCVSTIGGCGILANDFYSDIMDTLFPETYGKNNIIRGTIETGVKYTSVGVPEEYQSLVTDVLYFGANSKLAEMGKWEDVGSTLNGLFSKKYEVNSYIDPFGNVYTEKVPIENNLDDLNSKVLEASKNNNLGNQISREKIIEGAKTYEQARNKAFEFIDDIGQTEPYYGTMDRSIGYGKVVGRQSIDGKVRWRVDYDPQKGMHINVEDFRLGKGEKALKYAIPFDGDEKTFEQILKNLNK
nr:hemagglutinin repeat-containing protein [Sebaldella sp. S0638]